MSEHGAAIELHPRRADTLSFCGNTCRTTPQHALRAAFSYARIFLPVAVYARPLCIIGASAHERISQRLGLDSCLSALPGKYPAEVMPLQQCGDAMPLSNAMWECYSDQNPALAFACLPARANNAARCNRNCQWEGGLDSDYLPCLIGSTDATHLISLTQKLATFKGLFPMRKSRFDMNLKLTTV